MAHFSLSWDAYKQSICSGLSALQQNGEFVDMTVAADGHHVKVHQMVMSLVSPYIKELLASASCPHPVIFLNKVSATTLSAILEYIYTGEVLVAKDNLTDLIEAGKELRIKGLEDMKLELSTQNLQSQTMLVQSNEGQPLSETGYFSTKKSPQNKVEENKSIFKITKAVTAKSKSITDASINPDNSDMNLDDNDHHEFDDDAIETEQPISTRKTFSMTPRSTEKALDCQIQYTISAQGSLQMILNRFVYTLRYTSVKKVNGHRRWRCTDYRGSKSKRCPASVITRDEVVIRRFGAHNHPFHDKKILKKVSNNAVFTAINEAEELVHKTKNINKKEVENKPPTPKMDETQSSSDGE